MSRAGINIIVLALAAAAGLAGGVANANAARLPTATEAKALRGAFVRDHSHPRNAVISSLRISTVNGHWSLVKWFLPKRSGGRNRTPTPDGPMAGVAKARIITLHSSTYSGPPGHPKPAKQPPPPKVKSDLDSALLLILTSTISGTEDAHYNGSNPTAGCDQRDTYVGSLHSDFSWTGTWKVDVDKPYFPSYDQAGNVESMDYDAFPTQPVVGNATDKFSDATQYGCGGSQTTTCAAQYRAKVIPIPFPLIIERYMETVVPTPLYPESRSCSDGAAPNDWYTSRWFGTNTAAAVPLNIALWPGFDVGPFDVSFPRSAPYADAGVTSTDKGVCSGRQGDNCTDTLNWTGKVTVRVLAS